MKNAASRSQQLNSKRQLKQKIKCSPPSGVITFELWPKVDEERQVRHTEGGGTQTAALMMRASRLTY